MLVQRKAKGPTCSRPSPRNMKPEKRMQDRERKGRDGGRLEREKKLAKGAWDVEWEQGKRTVGASETLDSVMWCPCEVPEARGIVFEKAQQQLA